MIIDCAGSCLCFIQPVISVPSAAAAAAACLPSGLLMFHSICFVFTLSVFHFPWSACWILFSPKVCGVFFYLKILYFIHPGLARCYLMILFSLIINIFYEQLIFTSRKTNNAPYSAADTRTHILRIVQQRHPDCFNVVQQGSVKVLQAGTGVDHSVLDKDADRSKHKGDKQVHVDVVPGAVKTPAVNKRRHKSG